MNIGESINIGDRVLIKPEILAQHWTKPELIAKYGLNLPGEVVDTLTMGGIAQRLQVKWVSPEGGGIQEWYGVEDVSKAH